LEGENAPKSSSSDRHPDNGNDDDLNRVFDSSTSNKIQEQSKSADRKSDVDSAGVQSRQQKQTPRQVEASHLDQIENRIENCKREAEDILLARGLDCHTVGAALQLIEERSGIPSSAKYFIVSFDAAMADVEDQLEIWKRADRRRRADWPSTAGLEQIASKIEHESETSQRPITEVLEMRARGRSA
jgi:hypothetical protein